MTATTVRPMGGRVCVVTGASSGIGKATSVALAGLGATVVLVCRDRARGQAAMADVAAAAGETARPSLELADLSSMEQVRALAGRLGKLPAIRVLINNAGLVVARRQLTADGFELSLAVNHLAPFLLTNLLLPTLTASAPARVITVSSIAHRGAMLDVDDLQCERRYLAMLAYANSKLANVLFTRELARRLDATEVTANCLHPGTVRSRFGDTGALWLRLGLAVGGGVLRTPESGAKTSVYLASAPEMAGQTGGYYVNAKRRRPSRRARDDDLARRLWEASARLTGLAT
ncbi:MAG TPA: SDR family NAD(P)-dependent oxidoreductase [Streptosporangiaceae bacterium]|nr:SDR family NAD(P)-dependent oxidoreductase [Streptosporangiaceae bacterium]